MSATSPRRELFTDAMCMLAASALCTTVYLLVWWSKPDDLFWDDFQTQYLPATIEIGRALRAGEWPLLTTRVWFGGSLAGEYQYGVFSPVELFCAWLVAGFHRALFERVALLCGVHIALLAAGAYTLARVRGVGRAASCWVALAASLNGWIFGWGASNWYPAYTSFTWIPWSWAALELLRRPRASLSASALAAIPMALVILAGWPFTVAMLTLLVAAFVLAPDRDTPLRDRAVRGGLAFVLAVGLSTPAWWSLFVHGVHTIRAADTSRLHMQWQVPWSAWPGSVVAHWPALWHTYTNWGLRSSSLLFGGLVPVVGLLVGWRVRGRDFLRAHRTEFALLVVLALLATLPSVLPFRWSFRWLPLWHLVAALTGAAGLESATTAFAKDGSWLARLRERLTGTANRGFAALVLMAPCVFLLAAPGMMPPVVPVHALSLHIERDVGLLVAWMILDAWLESRHVVRALAPIVVATFTLLGALVGPLSHTPAPRWPLTDRVFDARPMDVRRRYLFVYTVHDILKSKLDRGFGGVDLAGVGVELKPGNLGLYAGLTTLNGYSPLGLKSLHRVLGLELHGFVTRSHEPLSTLARHTGPGRLLDLAGVDGLVLPEHLAARFDGAASGWTAVATRPGVVVYHRTITRQPVTALARALGAGTYDQAARLVDSAPVAPVLLAARVRTGEELVFGEVQLSNAREERNQTTVDVSVPGTHDALLVFARAWYPGFRATLDGRPLEVDTVNLVLPAVRVPARSAGRLVLAYRPVSVRYGAVVSAISCALVVALAIRARAATRPKS